jgi:hypothetical protein
VKVQVRLFKIHHFSQFLEKIDTFYDTGNITAYSEILKLAILVKSSQVNTLPKAKSKTRSKQNKDMHKYSSVYSERGLPLPVLTSGGE